MLNKKLKQGFLNALSNIEYGSVELVTPEGNIHHFEGSNTGPSSSFSLHDWSVIGKLSRRGDVGFAEDYRDGKWETSDLTSLLMLSLQNEQALARYIFGSNFGKLSHLLSYLFKRNTIKGSKKNILAHYDLGNDFYSLWLDPSMTYSSGIFNSADDSIIQAQQNKYDRIIDKFDKNSGNILEIGCGWGGFAERAHARGDFSVKGLTLSDEQHAFASKRLADKDSTIVLQDYRHEQSVYDFIVSIEMFEAVGERYWPAYFEKIAQSLSKKGKAVIQTITIDDALFKQYRKSGDVIRSFVFPGGMLPSKSRFKQEAEKAGLRISDSFMFGQDYAKTLQQWLDSFDANKEEVRKLGFDDAFIRMWRFYLATCIAGFTTNRTDVMQVELVHA